jgi:uncharacterized protein YjiS (DUF1127 family)
MPSASTTRSLAPSRRPRGVLSALLAYGSLARSRRALARLDDRLLRDIGLTRADAEAEAERPRWDAPPHWRA